MTTTIFLVRHATHALLGQRLVGRTGGVTLAPEGEAEAVQVAEHMSHERVEAIYSSPQARARQTAQPIGERLALPVQIAAELDEIDFGRWSGLSFAELDGQPLWSAWNTARSITRPPGGETMLEAQLRIVRQMERARDDHAGGRVVFVSHGDMIKAAVAHCLGLPLDALARFEIAPASVSTIVLGAWGAKLLSLNVLPAGGESPR